MKKKKRLALFMILSITQLFIAVFIVVKRENFIYLFPTKEPQTLRDLSYDRDKRLGYTVHVKEDGKLVPYLVLTKNYIGQGHVLLLRKYLVNPPMSFREGWEEAYYGQSIPDDFMLKDFIQRLSKDVQENIPLTELGIKPSEENAGTGRIEKIKRNLFLLSDIDVGNYKYRVRFEDDCNLLYFKRKGGVKEDRLAYLEGILLLTVGGSVRLLRRPPQWLAPLITRGCYQVEELSTPPISAQLSRFHLKQR